MNTEIIQALTDKQKARIDDKWARIHNGQLAFCIEIAKEEYQGKQKMIADRIGVAKSAVCMMIAVGESDLGKFNSVELLPSGWGALYNIRHLSEPQIKELCKDGPPTRKQIHEYRVKIGELEDKPKPVKQKAVTANELLEERFCMLVPDRERVSMSEFGWRGFMDKSKAINKLMDGLNKSLQKDTMRLLVRVIAQMEQWFQGQVRKEVDQQVSRYKVRLEAKEKEIARMHAQAVGLKQRITEKEIKIIQGCLHPDREVSAKRRAEAFNIFRRAF